MSYYLKRDLPTIKAGTEIEQGGADSLYWSPVGCIEHFHIPPEVRDDWIEERDGRWKPEYKSLFFVPDFRQSAFVRSCFWYKDNEDEHYFILGLVCPTEESAHTLALRMLEALKK